MDRSTNREVFVLARAVPSTDDGKETYILRDIYPTRGNTPTVWCRNNDDTVNATVKVQTSPDRETWTDLPGGAVTIKKKGRDKLSFTSVAKYLRFVLVASAPGGVHCELVQFAFDPAYQAGV